MRRPCNGHEMGCLRLLLPKPNTGDWWYETHRPQRPFQRLAKKTYWTWHDTWAYIPASMHCKSVHSIHPFQPTWMWKLLAPFSSHPQSLWAVLYFLDTSVICKSHYKSVKTTSTTFKIVTLHTKHTNGRRWYLSAYRKWEQKVMSDLSVTLEF